MNRIVFTIAATLLASSLVAQGASAMNIGSMSRQKPVAVSVDMASLAYPAVCPDLTCGIEGKPASHYTPLVKIAIASIGSLLGEHLQHAVLRLQAASLAD